MADALRMDVGEGAEKLVNVDLDLQDWHGGLHLIEEARRPVYGFGYKFENEVEVDFLFL